MLEINSGAKLWWSDEFSLVDYFRREYGEPVKCLDVRDNEFLSSHRVVNILTLSGEEKSISELYLRTSPSF